MYRSIALTIYVCIFCSPSFAEWQMVSISDSHRGLVPAMALASDGHPLIVHSGSNDIWCTWHDGSGWNDETLYYSPYGGPEGSDITIDGEDTCHVSFALWGLLHYSVGAGGSGFATEVVPGVEACWTSIGLDSSDRPVIACCNHIDDNVSLLSWTGSQWLPDTVLAAMSAGMETDCISMVMDQSFEPHIAFCSCAPQKAVMYAHRDQDEWQFSTVDSTLSLDPMGTSLALDSQGYPSISYSTQTELRYASWNGASWQIEVIDAMDTGVRRYGTSIALDSVDYPHICHVSAAGDSLLYSVNQGGGWMTESVCPILSSGGDPDLVLDELDRPRIAFYQGIYTGLGYAWNDDPTGISGTPVTVQPLQLEVFPNPFSRSTVIVWGGSPACGQLAVHDVSGRVVQTLTRSVEDTFWWDGRSNSGEELPAGTYIIQGASTEGLTSIKVVKL